MHRHLHSTLIASSSFMALLLISGWSCAEPLAQQPVDMTEHGMLETSSAQSQYLYNTGLQSSAPSSAEPPAALAPQSEWITTLQQPAQLAKPAKPGLRF
jgi:hypothetical protein